MLEGGPDSSQLRTAKLDNLTGTYPTERSSQIMHLCGGTIYSKGGPGMAAIFGPGGPIILPWTVRGDRFSGGTVHVMTEPSAKDKSIVAKFSKATSGTLGGTVQPPPPPPGHRRYTYWSGQRTL